MIILTVCIAILLTATATLKSIQNTSQLQELQGRILRGSQADVNQFPFQVLITGDEGDSTISCGGSIISEEYVLTAAHCTKGVQNVKVFTGSIYYSRGTMNFILPGDVFNHPEYNERFGFNDISLIKVPRLTFSDSVNSVRLATDVSLKYIGKIGITAGWGSANRGANNLRSLMYTEMTVIDKEECDKKLRYHFLLTSQLCAYNLNGAVPQSGDSGGPLILKDSDSKNPIQIGVAFSREKRRATRVDTVLYTRVQTYIQWITKITGIVLSNDTV